MLSFILNSTDVKTVLNSFIQFSKTDKIAISGDNSRLNIEHFNNSDCFMYNKLNDLNETCFDNDLIGTKFVFDYSDFIKNLKIYKTSEYTKFIITKDLLHIENAKNGTCEIKTESVLYRTDFKYNIVSGIKYHSEIGMRFCEAYFDNKELLSVLEKIVNVIPQDNYRRAITGLNVKIKSNSDLNSGVIKCEATDAHRAIITDLQYEKISFHGICDQSFIIPKNGIMAIIKLLKTFKKSNNQIKIIFYSDHIDLYTDNNKTEFYSDLIIDNFPDVQKIIPADTDYNAIIAQLEPVSREFLESFLKNSGKNDRIIFENDPDYTDVIKIKNYDNNRVLNIPVNYKNDNKWIYNDDEYQKIVFKANYLLDALKYAGNNILELFYNFRQSLKITNKTDHTVSVISRIVNIRS